VLVVVLEEILVVLVVEVEDLVVEVLFLMEAQVILLQLVLLKEIMEGLAIHLPLDLVVEVVVH
tara:strand:+ start:82 stop:270 length:189 start_codon:yes stop_codon:yes gene_type:complete